MALDDEMRATAIAKVRALEAIWGDVIPWAAIDEGFNCAGQSMHLSGRARGIFWPKQMARGVLSIKTTMPRAGRARRYDDIASDDGYFQYRFMGDDPRSTDNQRLHDCWEDQSPFLYFFAVAPSLYQAIYPVFISEWLPQSLTVHVTSDPLSAPRSNILAEAPKSKGYRTVEAKMRLHQAIFRQTVLSAYRGRCALSGLPLVQLLDAAHILPDRDQRGVPTPENGISMSSLHHRAYDAELIGIDADGIVKMSQKVAEAGDSSLISAFRRLEGKSIQVPSQPVDRPNRDYLAERFAQFQKAQN